MRGYIVNDLGPYCQECAANLLGQIISIHDVDNWYFGTCTVCNKYPGEIERERRIKHYKLFGMVDTGNLLTTYKRTREQASRMTTVRLKAWKKALHKSIYYNNRYESYVNPHTRRKLNAIKNELKDRVNDA